MLYSVCSVRAAAPAYAVGRVSVSIACASASIAPASPRCSRRQQRNRQAVNYEIDPCNAARQSGSRARVSSEGGKVMPAAAADIPDFCPAPAPDAGRSRVFTVVAAPPADAAHTAEASTFTSLAL